MPTVAKAYKPVVGEEEGPFSAAALVGVNTVILGWDVDPSYDRSDLLGFAIRRTVYDPDTKETLRLGWLTGQKRFKSISDDHGVNIISTRAPFQRFRWSDYTVNPDCSYLYEIFPMTGVPGKLVRQDPVKLRIRPTDYHEKKLGIYANRGVTAAMAYLNRFYGLTPSEVPEGAAYRWLSRGLKESLIKFIARAKRGDGLHVAIYEFHDADVADALKEALKRKVEVVIVYHAVNRAKRTVKESIKTLKKAGLKDIAEARTNVNLSHNKFVVLIKNKKPNAVWTGSSNFTEAGFYLQTNMGLVIENKKTAKAFEKYFQVLVDNPQRGRKKRGHEFSQDRVAKVIAESEAAMKGDPWNLYFSPVRSDHIIDVAVELVKKAKTAILMSTPFAMDKRIIEALGQNESTILEYGLANATAQKKIKGLNRQNTRFFTPKRLETYMGRSWDAKAYGSHKIHAKLLVVDPWSNSPSVLIGSSNFSDESCRYNDENALLAKGDQRLAAVIAAEFLRMFDHYKSRWFIKEIYSDKTTDARWLKEDSSWSAIYFDPNTASHKFRDREVFAGKR